MEGMKTLARAAIAVALFAFSTTTLEAATIHGTVRDRNGSPGQPLAGVAIYVWQHGGGWDARVVTGFDGYFETFVPDGADYNLAANKPGVPGFRADVSTGAADNVHAPAGAWVVVNFDLDGPPPLPPPPPQPARPVYDARVVSVKAPATLAPGQTAQVTIEYENVGAGSWDDATRVALSNDRFAEPGRGGTSPLEAPGWIARDRPASVGALAPGARRQVTFPIRAPNVAGTYTLFLELVQENVTWFDGHGDDAKVVIDVGGGPVRASDRLGLDVGAPIGPDGSIGVNPDVVAATGARWVRINFIAGPWSGPDDARRFQGRTWGETYDRIVHGLRAKGISVYGLVNTETLGRDSSSLRGLGDPNGARAYADAFAAAARSIVGRFKDRVRVFELVNEPNDWAGGHEARVHATWLAAILARSYRAVKLDHASDPSWQVTLVSGALFTHPLDDGAGYLRDVYSFGRREQGWDALRAQAGTYPLDGIGQHIYDLEGRNDAPSAVAGNYARHLDAVWRVVTGEDPEWPRKRLWLSEVGWRSSDGGEAHQADMLDAAFTALENDGRVALGLWFTLADFDPEGWGLYRQGGTTAANAKMALVRFQDVMRR